MSTLLAIGAGVAAVSYTHLISGHEYYSDRNGRDKKERNKRLA